jgi:hypothetical protein
LNDFAITRICAVFAKKMLQSNDEDQLPDWYGILRRFASIAVIAARLAAARHLCPDIRTLLFVISEAKRPKRFVYKEGHSLIRQHDIPNSDGS